MQYRKRKKEDTAQRKTNRMKKQCTKCRQFKSLDEFNKDKYRKDGLRHQCRECDKKYNRIHKIERSERAKEYYQKKGKPNGREQFLKSRYGLTLEQYDKMFEDQGGVCAICGGINNDGRRLYIDHNHKTGKIRSLLCIRCNSKLSVLEDEVFLSNAKKYLQNYKT